MRGLAPLIVALASAASVSAQDRYNVCGANYTVAIATCSSLCPGGDASECAKGENCFVDAPCLNPPTDPPAAGQTIANRCGTSFDDAVDKCGTKCPMGTDTECPTSETCFKAVLCPKATATPTLPPKPITPPIGSLSAHRRCGYNYDDANSRCGDFCPTGQDLECTQGMKCFQDITCSALPKGPSNRCGLDLATAGQLCGVPCPLGLDLQCPTGESCFTSVNCAAALDEGTTPPPTKRLSRHCGTSLEDACGDKCPQGTDAECVEGQYCFETDKCGSSAAAAAGPGAAAWATAALMVVAMLAWR